MNVALSRSWKNRYRRVASGKYVNVEDVLEQALLALISVEASDSEDALELEQFHIKMQQMEDAFSREDFIDPEEMFAELRERGRLMRQAAA